MHWEWIFAPEDLQIQRKTLPTKQVQLSPYQEWVKSYPKQLKQFLKSLLKEIKAEFFTRRLYST